MYRVCTTSELPYKIVKHAAVRSTVAQAQLKFNLYLKFKMLSKVGYTRLEGV